MNKKYQNAFSLLRQVMKKHGYEIVYLCGKYYVIGENVSDSNIEFTNTSIIVNIFQDKYCPIFRTYIMSKKITYIITLNSNKIIKIS